MLVLVATVATPVVVPMAMTVSVVMLMMPTILSPMSMSMPTLDTMHYAAGDALAWIPLPQGRCASRQHDSGGGGK
jgi:hypothetical protein